MRSGKALRALLAAAITAATMLTPDALVRAHGDNNDPAVIHACIDNKKGNVRIVPLNQNCDNGESRSHWATVGPAGPAGAAGPQGPPGAPLSSIDSLDRLACTREGFPGMHAPPTAHFMLRQCAHAITAVANIVVGGQAAVCG